MKSTRLCTVPECAGRHRSLGYCNKHYIQYRRYGKIVDYRPAVFDGKNWLIPLGVGARDGYAIIDESFKWLAKYKWYLSCGYALSRGPRGVRQMHRVITGASVGQIVDHANRNRLDNRLSNLRICTHRQNQANSTRKSKSGAKGVDVRSSNRYVAYIRRGGKRIYLGTYHTLVEAARAYDRAAVKMFGEYAYTNKMNGLY